MSTFVTGVPGTGKTAQVVAELVERRKINPEVKIYQHGIRELSLDHIQVYCHSDTCLACRDVKKEGKLLAKDWFNYAQSGDLLVFDEVQRIWQPRSVNSLRPDGVAMLETHRHFGVEFWLMTQHPKLVDSDVRRQMRKHLHVTAGWAGRKIYEWDTVNDNLQLDKARERPFKLPDSIFGLYKSADAHVVIDRKKPLSFYFSIAAIVLATVLVGFVSWRIKTKMNPEPVQSVAAVGVALDTPAAATIPAPEPAAVNLDFKPTIENRPETAPAYAHLLKVTDVPTLAGCIKSKNSCKCYTKQATPYPVTHLQCLEHVANLHFNPYATQSQTFHQSASDSQPIDNKGAFPASNIPTKKPLANDFDNGMTFVEPHEDSS